MDKTERLSGWTEDEKIDRNSDGIDDRIEPPIPDISAGSRKLRHELRDNPGNDPVVTGGDPDARWEAAQFSGDETPISDMPSPEIVEVEQIGRSMGIEYNDDEPLKVGEKERERDIHRWELDPASSEDYKDRVRGEEK